MLLVTVCPAHCLPSFRGLQGRVPIPRGLDVPHVAGSEPRNVAGARRLRKRVVMTELRQRVVSLLSQFAAASSLFLLSEHRRFTADSELREEDLHVFPFAVLEVGERA